MEKRGIVSQREPVMPTLLDPVALQKFRRFFLPIALVCWILDIMIGHRIRHWLARTWRRGFVHQIVLVVALFAVSIAVVRPIANISDRFGRRLRVDSITLKPGLASPIQKGMYCIGKRGSTYVFVDSLGGDSRTIYLLAEGDVSSLVLIYGR